MATLIAFGALDNRQASMDLGMARGGRRSRFHARVTTLQETFRTLVARCTAREHRLPVCRPATAALFAVMAALPLRAAEIAPEPDIQVEVHRVGDTVTIDVSLHVGVNARVAWDVLTDFDHMAGIVSNLRSSRVVSRSGDSVIVEQKGEQVEGLLRFPFATVRDVRLVPYSSMHARLISGTLKRMEGTTTLVERANGTDITSHGVFVPEQWLPPLMGEHFVRTATQQQYAEMYREMTRRAAAP